MKQPYFVRHGFKLAEEGALHQCDAFPMMVQ